MKQTVRLLQSVFYGFIILALLVIVLFESDILTSGLLVNSTMAEYYVLMATELVTVCVVPLALWMFRAKPLKHKLVAHKESALMKFGLLRLLMLGIPMVFNTFCYYDSMYPSFAYLAIILFLSMFFIFPSTERCMSEVSEVSE